MNEIFSISGHSLASTFRAGNPIITDVFTADPAAIVHDDTVYLYVGQDEAAPHTHYDLRRWLCYSSRDMKTWTSHGSPLAVEDFQWAARDAYAAHVIENEGKFYWFVSIEHDETHPGKAIGVAVSDSPTGPFADARGSALVTADMTSRGGHSWEHIDPAVFTDDDGASYLFWGNLYCYYARLAPNMIELDGPIIPIGVPFFEEAPWVHKRGELYYLSYASGFPEKMAYATAPTIHGPWTYRGLLCEIAGNSNTTHQAILEFRGQWYFFYHNGARATGDSYRRSVCVDYLYYNANGSIKRIVQTTEGTQVPPLADATASLDTHALPRWNRLQLFGNPDLFVRHHDGAALFSAYPFDLYEDAMWRALPGLSDAEGISLESVNRRDNFLRHDEGTILLKRNDHSDDFARNATFLPEAGLADASALSLRVAGAPELYLCQIDGALCAQNLVTISDKAKATFRLTTEGGNAGLLPVAP